MITLEKCMKYYGYIYEIRNKVNDKRYIGQTINKNLNNRCFWSENCVIRIYQHNKHLCDSIKKYRLINFERKIIDQAINQDELNKKEDYYIQKYHTLDRDYGYNLREGGSEGKLTKEHKIKIGVAHKNKKLSEEHKKKLSEIHKGKKFSKEHKIKISNKLIGHIVSKETRQKIGLSKKGKPRSEETKKKLSIINKGKISPMKGKKLSEISKEKISKNKTKYFFEKDYLIKEYWISEDYMKNRILDVKQKDMNEIAKKNNYNKDIIRRNLIKNNIPIRTKIESSKLFYLKKRLRENAK